MAKAKIPGLAQAQQFGEQFLLWGVMMQIAQTALAPVWAELQQKAFELAPDLPITPGDLVDAAVKGHLTEAQAAAEAKLSGLDPARFKTLLDTAGEPPGPATLLEMLRRGIIPETSGDPNEVSFEQGVKEGRTKNKWIEPYHKLLYQLPAPEAALNALLEGQTDRATAEKLYAEWGGDPEFFQLMFDTRGSAPTPLEAAEMARRGIIPWEGTGPDVVSFQQAFLEGPWRNKWLTPYEGLSAYRPPPRSIVAMVRNGALTDAQGLAYLKQAGLSDELASAFIAEAHSGKTATARTVGVSDVAALYAEKALSHEEAIAALQKLGYTAADSELELEIAGARREQSAITSATNRVKALYIGHHIDEQQAIDTLSELGIDTDQRGHLLATWKLERGLNIHTLTAPELASAVFYGLMAETEALDRLGHLGYGPLDAWYLIALRMHAPLKTPKPTSNVPPA